MSTLTGKYLNLVKPALTDDYKVTIGTDLPANFQKIEDEFSAHLDETVTFSTMVQRDMSLDDSTQIIILLPNRIPKKVTFLGYHFGYKNACIGYATSDAHRCVTWEGNGLMNGAADRAIFISPSYPSDYIMGNVTLETGQMKIAWEKIGSPTGHVALFILAEYHD